MVLNKKQKHAFDLAISGKNIYLGGPGGVGKSFLVNYFMDRFKDHTVLCAPTGIASHNIGGATINSLFKLPLHILTKKDATPNKKVEDLFAKDGPVKTIILDEVSTCRSDKFQVMDLMLRKVRRINKPFGGLQIIVVGDFFQLPPVVGNNERKEFFKQYDSTFAFCTETWSEANFEYVELDEIMRQDDAEFIHHLQNIRQKLPGFRESVDFFNKVGTKDLEGLMDEDPAFLCATNKAADVINYDNFSSLEGEKKTYHGVFKGMFPRYNPPTPETLDLKFGCKIIFTANGENYVNGQTGYIVDMHEDIIKVLLEEDETEIFVRPHRWAEIEYERRGDSLSVNEIGSYEQFPVKLAWGITIHKCQGVTLPMGILNFGRGCFASGQAYVALSRIKNLDGLGMMTPMSYNDVIVDKEVIEFYKNGCRGMGLF